MNENFKTLQTIVYLNTNDKIQVIDAELTQNLNLAIDIVNLFEEIVTEILFAIKFRKIDESYLFEGKEFYFNVKNLIVDSNKHYYIKPIALEDKFNEARGIDIRIENIHLQTGKTINFQKDEQKPYPLALISEDKKNKIKKALGPEIITYGENFIDAYRCVCGIINPKEQEECKNCKRNKNFILNNLTEPLINMKLINYLYVTEEIEDIKEEINNLTQTQLTKVAPDIENLKENRINTNPPELPKKSKLKKIIINLVIILILIVCGFLTMHFTRRIRSNYKFDKAKLLLEQGNYELALNEFEKLKSNDYLEVSPMIDKAKKLIESQNSFEKGSEFAKENKYVDAIREFKKVIPEDINDYNKSQDMIEKFESIVIEKVEKLINEDKIKNKDESLKLINNLLLVLPESAKAQNLKENLLNDHTEENISDEEDSYYDKTRAEIATKADGLLNTYQYVTVEKANLRTSPTLNSQVIVELSKGSDLYVKETKIEGTERIWCKVEALDSITNENYEGWMSYKNME